MTMKKIFALALGLSLIFSISACKDKDFDEKFADPSKTSTVSCDKLFSGAMFVGSATYKGFAYPTYWRLYTWEGTIAQFTQQVGFTNESGSVYYLSDSWATDRWNNFYEILAQFRLMQSTYNKEAAVDQEGDRIFVDLTEVFVYDHLAQLVDAFGPVPFTEAGYLGITGNYATSFPKYDSDEALYEMMIDRLGELYTDIKGYIDNPVTISNAKLKVQDFLNGGSLDKWLRYANSLRLRLAVHVAAKGSLVAKAKAAIAECAQRELVTNLENGIFGPTGNDMADGGHYYEWYRDGFAGDGKNFTASQTVIDAMMATGVTEDPRLAIFYYPNAAGAYVGKSVEETKAEQMENDTKTWNERAYATLDSVTFVANGNMKAPIFTPAEAFFLLAEARQAYGLAGSAEAAFKEGVVQSIIEWYDRNMTSTPLGNMSTGTQQKAAEAPSASDCMAYATTLWESSNDKLETIMTQKWLHFSLINAHESWTDIRRTGYPALYYRPDTQSQQNRNIVQRILYPIVEKNNNTANYNAAVADFEDTNDHVLFWAKKLQ